MHFRRLLRLLLPNLRASGRQTGRKQGFYESVEQVDQKLVRGKIGLVLAIPAHQREFRELCKQESLLPQANNASSRNFFHRQQKYSTKWLSSVSLSLAYP
jgi:hypothetical protein